jgi:hypothetical protein
MGKKRKSPWPFQKVLGSKRQFILLFGAHECFLPVLGHIRQPNSPNSWLFPFYHYPQSRGITFLLDMKRSFFGLSLSKRKGLALLPHFLLLQWVVVKLREKLLVTTVTFQISVHTTHTHPPDLLEPAGRQRRCREQAAGPVAPKGCPTAPLPGRAEPAADQQLSSATLTNNAQREGCPCVRRAQAWHLERAWCSRLEPASTLGSQGWFSSCPSAVHWSSCQSQRMLLT